MVVNEGNRNEFMGLFAHDFSAVMHAAAIVGGAQFSRYKSPAEKGSPGAFHIAVQQYMGIPKMIQAMHTGVGWHGHDAALFHRTEHFFRPGYEARLKKWCRRRRCGLRPRRLDHPDGAGLPDIKLHRLRHGRPGRSGVFSASTFICTPASRVQEMGLCPGAQAGAGRMRDMVTQGGFTHLRHATRTPFHLVYEAGP